MDALSWVVQRDQTRPFTWGRVFLISLAVCKNGERHLVVKYARGFCESLTFHSECARNIIGRSVKQPECQEERNCAKASGRQGVRKRQGTASP
ncbi:hypothetical protein ALPO108162_09195 [Alicyclobacillus pomorum]|jgi:hypothetical protein